MRKILFLCTLMLISCSRSDDSSETAASNPTIYGNWKLVSENGVAISTCEAKYPILTLPSNNSGKEGSGKVNSSNVCVDDTRDIQFTISDNVLSTKEINTNPAGYIFETKRTIVSNSGGILKLKIFYVRQSGPNGQVYTDNIPSADQIEYLYNKVN